MLIGALDQCCYPLGPVVTEMIHFSITAAKQLSPWLCWPRCMLVRLKAHNNHSQLQHKLTDITMTVIHRNLLNHNVLLIQTFCHGSQVTLVKDSVTALQSTTRGLWFYKVDVVLSGTWLTSLKDTAVTCCCCCCWTPYEPSQCCSMWTEEDEVWMRVAPAVMV